MTIVQKGHLGMKENLWLTHVRAHRQSYGGSYKQALIDASVSYRSSVQHTPPKHEPPKYIKKLKTFLADHGKELKTQTKVVRDAIKFLKGTPRPDEKLLKTLTNLKNLTHPPKSQALLSDLYKVIKSIENKTETADALLRTSVKASPPPIRRMTTLKRDTDEDSIMSGFGELDRVHLERL